MATHSAYSRPWLPVAFHSHRKWNWEATTGPVKLWLWVLGLDGWWPHTWLAEQCYDKTPQPQTGNVLPLLRMSQKWQSSGRWRPLPLPSGWDDSKWLVSFILNIQRLKPDAVAHEQTSFRPWIGCMDVAVNIQIKLNGSIVNVWDKTLNWVMSFLGLEIMAHSLQ